MTLVALILLFVIGCPPGPKDTKVAEPEAARPPQPPADLGLAQGPQRDHHAAQEIRARRRQAGSQPDQGMDPSEILAGQAAGFPEGRLEPAPETRDRGFSDAADGRDAQRLVADDVGRFASSSSA